jgi:hypothetical protein
VASYVQLLEILDFVREISELVEPEEELLQLDQVADLWRDSRQFVEPGNERRVPRLELYPCNQLATVARVEPEIEHLKILQLAQFGRESRDAVLVQAQRGQVGELACERASASRRRRGLEPH